MKSYSKPLLVINASAGSGKTYRLVKEFLILLVNEKDPSGFKRIIAMTFTNKAAFEMKDRIILALDQIAYPELHHHKADKLAQEIAQETAITINELSAVCRQFLAQILHQFEDFGVMTIDKFNLKLIKAFSRDLDLPADFEIAFKNEDVLSLVVDELLSKLGDSSSKEINDLILRFAKDRVDDGEKWNIRSELINFGKVLDDEKNKSGVDKLVAANFTLEHLAEVNHKLADIDSKFKNYCDSVLAQIDGVDPKEVHGGSTTLNSVRNRCIKREIIGSSFVTETVEQILNGETKKPFPPQLETAIINMLAFWQSIVSEYTALTEHKKQFYSMALLKYVAEELIEMRKRERIVRISEFNSLVGKLIQDEDAPFIYERLGNRYGHYLLDEFQDTSFLQWRNLIPLVHNSIAQGELSLIVGDAKQSIYRFKNGLAEQFVALPGIYNPNQDPKIAEQSEFFIEMGRKEDLNSNWRSSEVIVEFNNLFFSKLKDKLSDKGKDFYNSIVQQAERSTSGKVYIRSQKEPIDRDIQLEFILEQIEICQHEGFKNADICILGPRNKQCNLWAQELSLHGFKVVSADSLLISTDKTVQLVISFLQLRQNPSGESEKKQFGSLLTSFKKGEIHSYFNYLDNDTGLFDLKKCTAELLGNSIDIAESYESLYHLTQRFYHQLGINELENSYVHHLSDVIFEYEAQYGPDLKGFLEFYDLKKEDLAVQVPESDDAITIMTIHKSKGLEFPAVIIPSLQTRDDSNQHFIFEHSDILLYKKPSGNEIVPEAISIYEEEKDQTFLDKVNAFYVAMTRPVEKLMLLNSECDGNLGKVVHELIGEIDHVSGNEEQWIFEQGEIKRLAETSKIQTATFTPQQVNETLWFPDIALQDKAELNDAELLQKERQFGIEFHTVIAQCQNLTNLNDLSNVIDDLIKEGAVSILNKEELLKRADLVLNNSSFQELSADSIDVLLEQSILLEDGNEIRPDRVLLKKDRTVVIDFKTGAHDRKKDFKQVATYKNTLEEMGYPSVSGYLFYTDNLELVPVN